MNSPERSPAERRVRYPRRAGFTLIEMLVVITIISILASMLSPALVRARNTAVGMICTNNQRQLGLLIFEYADKYFDWLPVGYRKRNDYEKNANGENPEMRATTDNYITLMEILHRYTIPELVINCGDKMSDGYYSKASYVKGLPAGAEVMPTIFTCPEIVGKGLNVRDVYGLGNKNSYAPTDRKDGVLGKEDTLHKRSRLRSPGREYMVMESLPYRINPSAKNLEGLFPSLEYRHNETTSILYGDGHVKSRAKYVWGYENGKNDGPWCWNGTKFMDKP